VFSGTPRRYHPFSHYASPALNYADLEGEKQLERTKALNLQYISNRKGLDTWLKKTLTKEIKSLPNVGVLNGVQIQKGEKLANQSGYLDTIGSMDPLDYQKLVDAGIKKRKNRKKQKLMSCCSKRDHEITDPNWADEVNTYLNQQYLAENGLDENGKTSLLEKLRGWFRLRTRGPHERCPSPMSGIAKRNRDWHMLTKKENSIWTKMFKRGKAKGNQTSH
jgi:hypothetical protein